MRSRASPIELKKEQSRTQPAAPGGINSSENKTKIGIENRFHVFTWGNNKIDHSAEGLDGNLIILNEKLALVDRFLRQKGRPRVRIAYVECPESSFSTLKSLLVQSLESKNRAYKYQSDLLTVAETAFQFFLPLTFKGPTVDKFWGAILNICLVSYRDELPSIHVETTNSQHPYRDRKRNLLPRKMLGGLTMRF